MQLDLKRTLHYSLNKNINITGGLGLTKEDPIIILEKHHGLALEIEKMIIDVLPSFFRLYPAKIISQKLLKHQGAFIDTITVTNIYEDDQDEEKIQEVPIYFDISLAQKNIGKSIEEMKTSQELEKLYAGKYFSPNTEDNVQPLSLDLVALMITYGSYDIDVEGLMYVYEIDETQANKIYKAIEECGLLDPSVHQYYQKHFGHIYPEGYWEAYV